MDKNEWRQIPNLIRRLILSWLFAVTALYLKLSDAQRALNGLEGIQNMSFSRVVIITVVLFCGLCMLARWMEKRNSTGKSKEKDNGRDAGRRIREDFGRLERIGISAVFLVLSVSAWKATFLLPCETSAQMVFQVCPESIAYTGAVALISAILVVYAVSGWKEVPCNAVNESGDLCGGQQKRDTFCGKFCKTPYSRTAVLTVVCFTALFFGFVSIWTVCRVLTFSAPTFDFGIFSQMFYEMKTTGLPVTTLERDGFLSHFAVHVSPVYYLMLPFYCLYPSPVTLQILQAAVLALAVVPAWKLAGKHGFTPWAAVLLCLILMLYPAFSGGTSYDLHENVFLILFLLWMFYAIDCKNGWQTAVFGVLTLLVKEDAAVYVAVAALWLLLSSLLHKGDRQYWGIVTGVLLFLAAVIWFLLVTGYLTKHGDGVMTYRYSNFIYDGSSSLITVIKAAILSPMKVIYECSDPEKLWFMALTMLPLCGIPLMTRRFERLILLIPYILVNLMSDYRYQHDVFFQYSYGSTACLFYLTVINYEEITAKVRSSFLKYVPLVLAAVISGTMFVSVVVPKAVQYPARYMNYRAYYSDIREMLQLIPADASVTATTFYTVPLSNRDILYDVRYSSKEHILSTEYVVLGIHSEESYTEYAVSGKDGYDNFVKLLQENGYALLAEMEDTMVIYKKIS